VRNPIRVGEYVALCQAEMRGNRSAYPRLIRAPLTKPFRTVPRPVFLAYLGLAGAAAQAVSRAAAALGSAPPPWCEAVQTTRQLATVFSFYTAPRCVYDNSRLLALAASFSARDRLRFEVDPRCYGWAHYVQRVHLPGLERFAVRGEPAAMAAPAAPQEAVAAAAGAEAAPGLG
jgi:hypothetical protein